jgi:hypothetical protein
MRLKIKIKGSALIKVILTTSILSVACFGIIKLPQYQNRKQRTRTHRTDAFYTVENVILEGMQKIADEKIDPTNAVGLYYMGASENLLTLPYTPGKRIKYCALKIEPDPMGVKDNFLVTASARVETKMRSMQALVRWHPTSKVFDYEYFLNNWGWWWSGSINGWGNIRSNWDFDFKYNPYVYGHIFANGTIESSGRPVNPFFGDTPFRGTAGDDPLSNCHVGAPRVSMPNLLDFTYYEESCSGSIVKDGIVLIDAIHGDNEEKEGIYLEGTLEHPLELDGSVVIHGDVIIKGKITGQGVLYVGGNLYVADDIEYKNGPSFNPPPETMKFDERDEWVDSSMDKDLVCFAVRESIYIGDVNSLSWKSRCYNARPYGLRNVGDESRLGPDGIMNTPDDGLAYLDTNDDGNPDSAWYDADGDGEVDRNYSYNEDIKMDASRIGNIADYPINPEGAPLDFSNVATLRQSTWEGVYYTNHAFGMYVTEGPNYFNGALICRDEAIIFKRGLKLRYDSRIHSRYQMKYHKGDPNRIIDLKLPTAEKVCALDRYEIPPMELF